jgi:hypothetical protein
MLSLAKVMGICHGESIRHLTDRQRTRIEDEALAMYHRSVAEREIECLNDEDDEEGGHAIH